jgi:hypothetical protein
MVEQYRQEQEALGIKMTLMEAQKFVMDIREEKRKKSVGQVINHTPLDPDDPWSMMANVTPNNNAKVQFPQPEKFDGDVSKLIPSSYLDLSEYMQHIGKVAQMGKLTIYDVVNSFFRGTALQWARNFMQNDIFVIDPTLARFDIHKVAENNKVYRALLSELIKHFGPQLRSRKDDAMHSLAKAQYAMKQSETVAMYHARFSLLAKEAGTLTPDIEAYLFREGLKKALMEQTIYDPSGNKLLTKQEVFERALIVEETMNTTTRKALTVAITPHPSKFHAAQRGRGQKRNRGQRGGRRDESGDGGGRGYRQERSRSPQPTPQGKPYGRNFERGRGRGRERGRGRGRGRYNLNVANFPSPPKLTLATMPTEIEDARRAREAADRAREAADKVLRKAERRDKDRR